MRCVACDHNSKKRGREVENLCPKCGHQFALDPKVDGIADGFMKQAVAAVSSNGAFKYLPEQLDYEVRRRSRPPTFKQQLSNYRLEIAALVAGPLILAYMAISGNAHPLAVVIIASVMVWAVTSRKRRAAASRRPKDPKAALRRYEAINPPTNKLGPGPYRPDRGHEAKLLQGRPDAPGEAEPPDPSAEVAGGTELVEIEAVSKPVMAHKAAFDRLLVCEYPSYRDFYIANDFNLHHVCHVVGPDDLKTEDGRALLDQLKQKPELDVFVVHDATPRGVRFVDEVQSDRRWFGGHAAAAVLDLGLVPDQLPMFEAMLRPLAPEEMEGVDQAVKGLPENMGADLSVIPAGSLLSLTGASVDERLSFDKNSYTKRKSEDKRRGRDESDWWRGDGE